MPSTDLPVERNDRLEPVDVFELLANDARIDILLALGDATEFGQARELSFSELRETVAIRDSGRFNYHLDKLVGTFVKEGEDGYDLRYPGVLVYEAIVSGSLTDRSTVEPFEIGATCTTCGNRLAAAYSNQLLTVRCDTCEQEVQKSHVPPGALDAGTVEHLLHAAGQFTVRDCVVIREGVCPNCAGRLRHDVIPEGDREGIAAVLPGIPVLHRCRSCGYFVHTSIGFTLMTVPPVIEFFDDHGIDLLGGDLHFREFPVDPESEEIRSRDPWEVSVEIELDDEVLEVVVDGSLAVQAVERRARPGP